MHAWWERARAAVQRYPESRAIDCSGPDDASGSGGDGRTSSSGGGAEPIGEAPPGANVLRLDAGNDVLHVYSRLALVRC